MSAIDKLMELSKRPGALARDAGLLIGAKTGYGAEEKVLTAGAIADAYGERAGVDMQNASLVTSNLLALCP